MSSTTLGLRSVTRKKNRSAVRLLLDGRHVGAASHLMLAIATQILRTRRIRRGPEEHTEVS